MTDLLTLLGENFAWDNSTCRARRIARHISGLNSRSTQSQPRTARLRVSAYVCVT